MSSFKA